jgi:hypothetical protein
MRYTDFVLLAREPHIVKSEGKKRLSFSLLAPGIFNDPISCELDARAVGDLKEKASGPDADWNVARLLGEALAAALLPQSVWNALNNRITQATAKNEGVRVRLMLSGGELNNWPWEFIIFNRAGGEPKVSDFLVLMPNVSLVRHTPTPLPAWRVEAKVPARVLVAVASPSKWPKLKVADERTLIEKALEGKSRLKVDSVEHVRRCQLPDKTKPTHIFHFAGHGNFETVQSPVPGAYEGKASIILEDEYGNEDSLDAELLAVQLRDAGVRVAVLGACLTAERDDVGAWSSVAEALLKAELAAVVGMQFPVVDKSALCFAERFYGALAVGLNIDEAVAAGRVAVAVSGDPRGWATPVLYLRSPDGAVFTEFEADQDLDDARLRKRNEGLRMFVRLNKGQLRNLRIGEISLRNSDERPVAKELVETLEKIDSEIKIDINEKGAAATNVEIGKISVRGRKKG